MADAWHFLGSTTLQRLGKLTLREDLWRLPTGDERRYPVLHVGPTVGVVPFVDPEHVLLVRQFRHLVRADSWELPGGVTPRRDRIGSPGGRGRRRHLPFRCLMIPWRAPTL